MFMSDLRETLLTALSEQEAKQETVSAVEVENFKDKHILLVEDNELSLSYVQLKGDDSRCFGINENNTELILILNRGLRIIGASFGMESSYKYIGEFYIPNFIDYFMKNIHVFLPILILVVGGIILMLAVSLHRKAVQVSENETHIRQVQALNEELDELRRKADAANEAKSEFLFNMSHDIRTPMNAILGFTSLMEENITDTDKLKDYLGKIKSSGKFLLSLINNVLEMAKIESGKAELDETSVNLREAQKELLSVFDAERKKKNLSCTHKWLLVLVYEVRVKGRFYSPYLLCL